MSKCKSIGKIEDSWRRKAKEVTWAAFMADELGKSRAALPPLKEKGNTATDAVALELKDRDEDGNSGIAWHPEEVYVGRSRLL